MFPRLPTECTLHGSSTIVVESIIKPILSADGISCISWRTGDWNVPLRKSSIWRILRLSVPCGPWVSTSRNFGWRCSLSTMWYGNGRKMCSRFRPRYSRSFGLSPSTCKKIPMPKSVHGEGASTARPLNPTLQSGCWASCSLTTWQNSMPSCQTSVLSVWTDFRWISKVVTRLRLPSNVFAAFGKVQRGR